MRLKPSVLRFGRGAIALHHLHPPDEQDQRDELVESNVAGQFPVLSRRLILNSCTADPPPPPKEITLSYGVLSTEHFRVV